MSNATTLEETIKAMLVSSGLTEKEAGEVMVILKQYPDIEMYAKRWTDDPDAYSPAALAGVWLSAEDAAVEWIDENMPRHWARALFANKESPAAPDNAIDAAILKDAMAETLARAAELGITLPGAGKADTARNQEILNAILNLSAKWVNPRARDIEERVLKPMMEARIGVNGLETHEKGFPRQIEVHLAKLCDIVIAAAEVAACHDDKDTPGPVGPSAGTLAYARDLKRQCDAQVAGRGAATLEEIEQAIAAAVDPAGRQRSRTRGAVALTRMAQKLEKIAEEEPQGLARNFSRRLIGAMRGTILKAIGRGPTR